MTSCFTLPRRGLLWLLVLAAHLAAGCSDDAPTAEESPAARLARYRKALPQADQLAVAAPLASTNNFAGEAAQAPVAIADLVTDVNGAVVDLLSVLQAVTATPPTAYNELSREYFWGLFPNDDGVGYLGVYIRENANGADFRYSYAIGRAPTQAVADFESIIWGGANPDADNPDFGSGAILWDFEANHFFEVANNGAYDEASGTRGRFVSVYGRGPEAQDPAATVTLVYAAFANFQDQGAAPVDAEYLWGKVDDGSHELQFVDVTGTREFAAGNGDAPEAMTLHAAYLDSGIGRAESTYSGEAIPEGSTAISTECWDTSLARTYYGWTLGEQNGGEGEPAACGALFSQTLAELSVPSLASVPQFQRDLLTSLAENGVPTP